MAYEEKLRQAVEDIFIIYDTDDSKTLELDEAKNFFTDLFDQMGEKIPDNAHEIILNSIDRNGDGKLSKEELFYILKEACPE